MKFDNCKPNSLHIGSYIHCNRCLKETGDKPYAQDMDIGWTEWGLQVWCRRHDINMMHINFEGQCHPSDSTRSLADEKLK